MTYDEFEASRTAPCPACGAKWVKVRGTRGGREMTHALDCAYMREYWGIDECLLDDTGGCHTCDQIDDEAIVAMHEAICQEWEPEVDDGWHPADDPRHLTSSRIGFSVAN